MFFTNYFNFKFRIVPAQDPDSSVGGWLPPRERTILDDRVLLGDGNERRALGLDIADAIFHHEADQPDRILFGSGLDRELGNAVLRVLEQILHEAVSTEFFRFALCNDQLHGTFAGIHDFKESFEVGYVDLHHFTFISFPNLRCHYTFYIF